MNIVLIIATIKCVQIRRLLTCIDSNGPSMDNHKMPCMTLKEF